MPQAERLVRPRDAYARCAVSESYARRDSTFPKPVILSKTRSGRPARVAFIESELEQWIAAQIRAGRAACGPEAA